MILKIKQDLSSPLVFLREDFVLNLSFSGSGCYTYINKKMFGGR